MRVKIWKNTGTLDRVCPWVDHPVAPAEAEVAVVGGQSFALDDFPKLRAIFRCGVGTDNIPFEACARRGIEVWLPGEETRDIIFEETANFAAHLILRLLYLEVGEWAKWKKYDRPFLARRKVLLVGEGNIGSRVRSKLSAMVAVDAFDAARQTPGELEPLVRTADVVSLHVPLVATTRGFWDAGKLAWMRDGAGLVNTSRGPVLDEEALYVELARGRLRAALDVFSKEPYAGPLADLPENILLKTPHVASTCQDFIKGLATDLERYLSA